MVLCGRECGTNARYVTCKQLWKPQRVYERSRAELAHFNYVDREWSYGTTSGNELPCSQTSRGGPLQRTIPGASSLLTSILRSGFGEAYVTQVRDAAQALLREHRALLFPAIMGIGSRQRSMVVLDRRNDEKQATPVVSAASPEQQSLDWP